MEAHRENLENFNYSDEDMINDVISKLNLTLIYNLELDYGYGDDLITWAINDPNFDFINHGSILLSYIYDKNKMNEINEIIRLNKYNQLNINYTVGNDFNDNTQTNIRDYILNSLWAKLRAYKFENIINDNIFDIHIFYKDTPVNRKFKFSTKKERNKSLAIIQKKLKSIATKIVERLNNDFSKITHNITNSFSGYFTGINIIDPSILNKVSIIFL